MLMFGIFNIRQISLSLSSSALFLKFSEYGKTRRDLVRAETSSERSNQRLFLKLARAPVPLSAKMARFQNIHTSMKKS